jgi:hypothetical protein
MKPWRHVYLRYFSLARESVWVGLLPKFSWTVWRIVAILMLNSSDIILRAPFDDLVPTFCGHLRLCLYFERLLNHLPSLNRIKQWPSICDMITAGVGETILHLSKQNTGTAWTLNQLWSSHLRSFVPELRSCHARNKLYHFTNKVHPRFEVLTCQK